MLGDVYQTLRVSNAYYKRLHNAMPSPIGTKLQSILASLSRKSLKARSANVDLRVSYTDTSLL